MRKLLGKGTLGRRRGTLGIVQLRMRARGGQEMATYVEIRKFVQRRHGFVPKNGWIAHVKALRGLPTRRSAKRAGRRRRVEPCPPEKREAIEEALRHFGLI
jgi:hypothetical protein